MGRHVPWDRSPEPILPGLFKYALPFIDPIPAHPTCLLAPEEVSWDTGPRRARITRWQTLLGRMGTVGCIESSYRLQSTRLTKLFYQSRPVWLIGYAEVLGLMADLYPVPS